MIPTIKPLIGCCEISKKVRNNLPAPGRAFPAIALCLAMLPSLASGASFLAKVIHIADGDTITVLKEDQTQVKIRVNGIDCPEKGQAFGKKATQFTKDLVAERTVTLETHGQDKYGRTIANVVLDDGRDLSQELVRAGYAWWFFKYSNDEHLGMLEVRAKIAKVGLWNDPNPIPPWIYRKRQRAVKHGSSTRDHPGCDVSPLTPGGPSPILGNQRSRKYHRPDCPSYCNISKKNRHLFPTVEAAEKAGFVVAKNCPK